jgi:protein RecA
MATPNLAYKPGFELITGGGNSAGVEPTLEFALSKVGTPLERFNTSFDKTLVPISYAKDSFIGVPRGHLIEVIGHTPSSKSTLALKIVAGCQKADGLATYIDSRHALDVEEAGRLRVQMDFLLVSQPDYCDQGIEFIQTLVESGSMDLIVLDSVEACVAREQNDCALGFSKMEERYLHILKIVRKLTSIVEKSNTCIFFI